MSNDSSTASDGGPSASSRRLGAAVLGLLHSHVELFGIELQEQKARTVSLLLFAGLALVFALLLLVGLSALVLILLWDSYRLAGIIGLCLFYALAALFCGLRLKAAVFDESSPFHATLEELANDRERLLP
ncbi:phage holin family protein [Pseudomonas sp. NFXW11]|uniref:phage holin family protein n=1 Tax=Pseudomonas sp. NFXW11 TaxID=2819531 RepID=UPI003CF4577A